MTNNLRKLAVAAMNIHSECYNSECYCKQDKRDYIAAASPDVVLGLLDEIERLRSVIQIVYDNSIKVDWPDDIWDAIKGELK